jgi:hypothetical protein
MFSSNATQVSTAANYIEDVFSTWLYNGNGSSQTIANGIDLSTKGGMVWIKKRDSAGVPSIFGADLGGPNKRLRTITTDATQTFLATPTYGVVPTTSGFNLVNTGNNDINDSASTSRYVSWTFAKQSKFFDVVTYTGNLTAGRTIAHSLGSVPGCIIVKQLSGGTTGGTNSWFVYHRSLGATKYSVLNTTAAAVTSSDTWNNTEPTSTQFTVGGTDKCNDNGGTYVAYLFAHDAGGFGPTGTDNVISCGTYTGNGSTTGPIVTLGYEPQWVMIKKTNTAASNSFWYMFDDMRGMPVGTPSQILYAQASDAESTSSNPTPISPLATGFQLTNTGAGYNGSGDNYIYIAIRRGPMKVPTTGTSVFSVTSGNFSTPYTVTTGFPVDLCYSSRTGGSPRHFNDRLRGPTVQTSYRYLATNTTDAELTGTFAGIGFQSNTSIIDNDWVTGANAVWWNFRRAPGFFDEVCYTGTGVTRTITHNLAAVPELIIVKSRSRSPSVWAVYSAGTGNTKYLELQATTAAVVDGIWNNTTPTSTVFSVDNGPSVNDSGSTYVAYLFATCPGVSKVGSYTGNGSTQTIDCGFTGGARFVLIKRTDSTGDWYVWDSARGMIPANDPYLLLNSTAAEVTGTDYVDTTSVGFEITSTAPAAINANGGSFIFLAIA